MSDSKPQNDRTVMYLLGVVAVLLVVIVAIIIVKSQGSAVPSVATTTQPSAQTTGSLPGVGSSKSADFDPKTATKVPAGTTPEQFVKAYYQAILDKKWDAAFKMQPAASQAGNTAEGFKGTQTSYGMKTFKIASAKVAGGTATVVVEQDLGANGQWGATWTLVKAGNGWVVKERQVTMK